MVCFTTALWVPVSPMFELLLCWSVVLPCALAAHSYPVCFALQILLMSKEINPVELDFLLRYPAETGVTSPVEFLSNHSWGGIKVPAPLAGVEATSLSSSKGLSGSLQLGPESTGGTKSSAYMRSQHRSRELCR